MRGFGGIKQRANEKLDSQKLPPNRFDNFDIDGFRVDGWIAFRNQPHHDARFANSISIKIRNDAPNQHNNDGVNNIFLIMAKVDFAKGHATILSGSVKFARMTRESGPDQMNEKYGCDLELDKASIKQLTDLGILEYVRARDVQGNFKHDVPVVKIKSINIPKAYLANRQSFDGLIGDGSEIRANVWIKKWEHKGKTGLSIWVSAYVITNLVEYAVSDSDALFDGLPDLPELKDEQSAPVPSNKPQVATASEAFDESDDDLLF